MKLGTETGSLVNHIATHNQTDDLPKVGDGATIFSWSDRSPATVIAVDEKKKLVTVQMDKYKRTDDRGMSDMQDYEYTPDPEAPIIHYKLKKSTGVWNHVVKNLTGRWVIVNKGNIRFGARSRYYDFSF